ncbi:TlpA family protein disulfide reductase [Botryobacter ruber]|uniref:TlpA family protein disulfide reductase n=1 Tax=Botryobacter ruber TaxID=2171629 RepID=UPI000E0AD077|nr:TlpA disulfide reductase family protein [Botryobacter ruber]
MKRVSLFLLLALLLTTNGLLAQSKVVITGKVTKPLSEYVTVVTYPSPFVPEEVENEVELQGEQFRLEIPVSKAMVAELVHGDEVVPVYLEPGFELNLSFNGGKFLKTIKYEGKGANENNYLAQSVRRFSEIEEYQVLPDNVKLREGEFIEFLDYRKNDQENFLEKFTAKAPVSATFKSFAQAEIDFAYADDRITYFDIREQVIRTEGRLTPSPSYFKYLETLDMQRQTNLLSPAFTSFLRNYTTYYTKAAGIQETNKEYYITGYNQAKKKLTAEVQALALAQVLRQSLQKGHLKYSEEMLRDFLAINKHPEAADYLQKLYDKNKDFAIGSPAPNFKLTNANGDTVALSDFKGKVIYLSFWRSDCGLCLIDLPHLQDLTSRLENESLVFLNVSMDEDAAAWRNAVAKKRLQGVQLHMKEMDADLVKRYELKNVPAYFLIDEEGNLITAKPRRPNDREVEKDLQRLTENIQASAR